MRQNKTFRLAKPAKWVTGILFVVYLLYVTAVAVFLNTPLFAQVAGMESEEQTHVRFTGAYSLWPGHLYVPKARVFIGDQNVSIGIDVHQVRARFSLRPLLEKRLVVDQLLVGTTEVDVGMKNEAQKMAYTRKFAQAGDLDLKLRQRQAEENAKKRLTLDFKKIIIDRLQNVRGGFGRLDGEMSLHGGFLIQPKVQVEIYPSTLYFLSGIVGRADVRFDRFKTVDAPGNAVWPYVTAHLDFNINTESLKRLDFSLENLPGYSLDGIGSNGRVDVRIVKGQLQKGSVIESLASRLTVRTPGLDATGIGRLRWTVESAATSRLRARLSGLRLAEKSRGTNRGRIRSADLDIRLFGNGLVSAFSGVSMLLRMKGLDWHFRSPERVGGRNFAYQGRLAGDGQLAAYSGQVPAWGKRDATRTTKLDLRVPELLVNTSFVSEVRGQGRIRLSAYPIDLGINTAQFPEVDADLDLKLGNHGDVRTRAVFSRLEHQLSPENTWKGRVSWKFDRTDAIVDAIVAQAPELPGVVKSLARVRDLELDLDCELSDEIAWMRFSRIRSSGIWKGYGTLRSDERGLSGLFEASVLTMPVGVWVQPERTEVKFLPDREWYDRALLPPIPPLPDQPRIPLGRAGKRGGAI